MQPRGRPVGDHGRGGHHEPERSRAELDRVGRLRCGVHPLADAPHQPARHQRAEHATRDPEGAGGAKSEWPVEWQWTSIVQQDVVGLNQVVMPRFFPDHSDTRSLSTGPEVTGQRSLVTGQN